MVACVVFARWSRMANGSIWTVQKETSRYPTGLAVSVRWYSQVIGVASSMSSSDFRRRLACLRLVFSAITSPSICRHALYTIRFDSRRGRSGEHTSPPQSRGHRVARRLLVQKEHVHPISYTLLQ